MLMMLNGGDELMLIAKHPNDKDKRYVDNLQKQHPNGNCG
jgi:hypothetical protein